MSASTVKPKPARRSNKPSCDLIGRSLNALATFSKSDFRAVKIKSCEEVKKSDKLLKFVLNGGSGEDRVILSGIKKYYDPSELVGKTAIAIVNLPPRKMMDEYSNGMLIRAVNEYDVEEMLNLLLVDYRIPAGSKLY